MNGSARMGSYAVQLIQIDAYMSVSYNIHNYTKICVLSPLALASQCSVLSFKWITGTFHWGKDNVMTTAALFTQ